jgi:hypothetical protein
VSIRGRPKGGVPVLISLLAVALVLVLLLGTGVLTYRSRKRFIWAGETFRCRIRNCAHASTSWPRRHRRWSRPMWAAWSGDVLRVRRGPVFNRVIALQATITTDGVYRLPMSEAKRCGPHPVAVCLRVQDGSRIEVVTAEEARLDVVGPYLVAAIHGLPGATVPGNPS